MVPNQFRTVDIYDILLLPVEDLALSVLSLGPHWGQIANKVAVQKLLIEVIAISKIIGKQDTSILLPIPPRYERPS